MSKYKVKLIVSDYGIENLKILRYLRSVIMTIKSYGVHVQIILLKEELVDEELLATLKSKGIEYTPTLITDSGKINGYNDIRTIFENEIKKFNNMKLRTSISDGSNFGSAFNSQNIGMDMAHTPVYGNFDGDLSGYMAAMINDQKPDEGEKGGYDEAMSDDDYASMVSRQQAYREQQNARMNGQAGKRRSPSSMPELAARNNQPGPYISGQGQQARPRLADNINSEEDETIPQQSIRSGLGRFMGPPQNSPIENHSSGFQASSDDAESKFDAAFRDKMNSLGDDDNGGW